MAKLENNLNKVECIEWVLLVHNPKIFFYDIKCKEIFNKLYDKLNENYIIIDNKLIYKLAIKLILQKDGLTANINEIEQLYFNLLKYE